VPTNTRRGLPPVLQPTDVLDVAGHYVPPPGAILTAVQVAEWLQLKNRQGVLQPRLVQRLGIPAIRLGHKTLRYRASSVARWLEQREAA
jgi:hypothetical protein